jgi:YVTN family beta-propeller protein
MKFTQRGIVLISLALAGLAPSAASLASTSPAAGHSMTRTANQCIQVTATIPLARASGGIAVNPKTDTIYVASGQDKVHLISGQTNTVIGTIVVGRRAGRVAVDPKTDTIYVANERDKTVSVISGRTNTVTSTIPIPVGRFMAGIAVNPSTDTIYVAVDLNPAVVVISGQTDTVTGTIPLGVTGVPSGIAADPATNTVFVANAPGDGVAVISGQTDKVVARVPVGLPVDAIAVNPNTDTAYATYGENGSVGCPELSGRGSNRISTGKDGVEWQERNAVISPRNSKRKPPGWW